MTVDVTSFNTDKMFTVLCYGSADGIIIIIKNILCTEKDLDNSGSV